MCVVVIVLVVGALYRDMNREVEVVPPSESQGVDTPEAAIRVTSQRRPPERSVAALVAGFGLITIWVGAEPHSDPSTSSSEGLRRRQRGNLIRRRGRV